MTYVKRENLCNQSCRKRIYMLKNDLNAFVDIRLENSYTKGKRETIMKEIDKYEFTCI